MFSSSNQIWAYEVFPALATLHLVVHEENAYIPRILHWRSNTSGRFHELMSQVFENHEVDVQLLQPTVIDKHTSASVEEKDNDIDEIATLSSSSKGKAPSTELRTLKRDFQRTKDELANVASSNRALRNRVHALEEILEIEELKKRNGGLNEGREGHEELGSPHMNEGGDNDMPLLHEYVSPPTAPAAMKAQVPGDGAEPFAAIVVEPFAAIVVEEAEMAASVPHIQVHEATKHAESEKLPTPEDVAGCNKICKRLLFLLEDWKITDSMPSGGPMNPPRIPKVSVAGDEEGSASVEKQDVEAKGCRKKRPAQTLLSPFTNPLRKKRTTTVSDVAETPPCFDPTKPLPIEDVKAVIEFCTAWKKDIRSGFFTFEIQSSCYCRSHWIAIEIDFVRHTATVYDTYIAFTSTWKLVKYLHPISDTLARVLNEMHFYDASEVQEVKQKGMKMSTFMPFTVCRIGDVPQQRDGTPYGILTFKFIEYLSAGISLDKIDPLKIKYYRLKLAIEGLKGQAYI
ncbi:hypothetical protein L3X38_011655 [Prunus dulcis]|uniref:Ubiquitin-like protease family profile domain-containing protein n=1 Tax=Prunus dulcis TaxID=3755 RepID=A0AAD4ZFB8_PRUDU|nr:hypothetical protein L3X38_011655 [Prunus dulcis]